MTTTINIYTAPGAAPAGDGVPEEWSAGKIDRGEPEPPVGSVVIIHTHVDGRLEPAMRTTSGWVTPTTWVSEDWPWRDDLDHDIYLVHEGSDGD